MWELMLWLLPVNPLVCRLKQEDSMFEVSMDTVSSCVKEKKITFS